MSPGVNIRCSRTAALLLLVVSMLACRGDGDGGPNAPDTHVNDLVDVVCEGLAEEECAAADACRALEGWTVPEACLVWADKPADAPLFAACVSVDIACEPSFTWAASPTDPTEPWLFPSCTPDGWGALDPDGYCCLPDCEGKECGDDGCGGECCGGEPVEPGDPPCCGGIADETCSEYCPGWGSEPPRCIPPVECIQPCIEECPPGWDCINYAFYGTDVAFYCFPEPLGPPCQPCETNADCPGGILWEVNRCAAVLDEVPTCVSPCSAIPKLPCPPWFTCVSAETVDGEVLDVCVPDSGQCECLPEVETCDGEDNDCDGETDEDCPSR